MRAHVPADTYARALRINYETASYVACAILRVAFKQNKRVLTKTERLDLL